METSVSEPETEWDIVGNKGKYTTYLIIVSVNFLTFFPILSIFEYHELFFPKKKKKTWL